MRRVESITFPLALNLRVPPHTLFGGDNHGGVVGSSESWRQLLPRPTEPSAGSKRNVKLAR